MVSETDVFVRHIARADQEEFLALMQCSRFLHEPWISPPTSSRLFELYLARIAREDHAGFAVCAAATGAITGIVNINNIVRGSFLSASLGYYAGAPYAGRGYMFHGLSLVVREAFQAIGLHRLEANIQPENHASKRLVARCGFQYEGLSPAFLFIDGQWRDHERWTLIDQRRHLHAGPAET